MKYNKFILTYNLFYSIMVLKNKKDDVCHYYMINLIS